MATYPGAVKTFVDRVDLSDVVMAADVNSAYAEITAIETALGVNPYTIDDTVTAGSAVSSVGNYLDQVAYALKQIKKTAAWYTASPLREVLTAARTYYVATTGNDSNTGLTVGSPFLTLQKALDTAAMLDLSIYNCTVQLADGTYTLTTATLLKQAIGSGTIIVKGNTATPANVIITSTTNISFMFWSSNQRATFLLQDFKMTTTGGTNYALFSQGAGSTIQISNLIFGSGFATAHLRSLAQGLIQATGNYAIEAGTGYHLNAVQAAINVNSRTITITGSPAFSSSFAFFSDTGYITTQSANWSSGSAAVTGKRYDGYSNAVLNSAAAALPGNAAGTVTSGAQAI
jgi:hypothetical protein